MTSHDSTQLNIWDELTSSQEDSPANLIPTQVSDLARMTTATSGRKCYESYVRFNPPTWSEKMCRALCRGTTGWFSRRCKLTWKMKGTKYKRTYFQLAVSTLPTEETGFGLLPTVMSQTRERTEEECRERQKKYGGEKRALYLDHLAAMEMLPTPNAFDWNTARKPETYEAYKKKKAEEGVNLQMPLKQLATNQMLPTPKCQEERGNASRDRGKFNLPDEVARIWKPPGKTSQLSPLFVEEMMGFPAYWTASPFQSGDEKASKPTETPSSHK